MRVHVPLLVVGPHAKHLDYPLLVQSTRSSGKDGFSGAFQIDEELETTRIGEPYHLKEAKNIRRRTNADHSSLFGPNPLGQREEDGQCRAGNIGACLEIDDDLGITAACIPDRPPKSRRVNGIYIAFYSNERRAMRRSCH